MSAIDFDVITKKKYKNMKQVFPSSPAMLDKPMRGVPEAKYPWKTINVGESFPVDAKEIKLSSLRPFATRMGKKHGKKFRVVDHKNGTYEVGCLQVQLDPNDLAARFPVKGE